MSARHPIIAVTGSSGAGTTTVSTTFDWIFRREKIRAAMVEGDAFHRYDRMAMRAAMKEAEASGNRHFSHFGPQSNLFGDLEELFRSYALDGVGRSRHYIHDEAEAEKYTGTPGTFTAWEEIGADSDLLYYEGLHGAVVTDQHDVAQYPDLLIGVAPSINLEWIQKIHRDRNARGYSTEAVVDTILRRMPDYQNYICPQFSRTHINFQRVPIVDTSNPFVAKDIPLADESFLVIRFANPRGIDFPYLLSMIHDSFMSRPNTIVAPGGKLPLAMQLILTPLILRLMDTRKRAF
jgi:phosphoribulokinase